MYSTHLGGFLSHSNFEGLLGHVINFGDKRPSRAGMTQSIFAPDPLRFDLSGGRVPLLTSKAVPWKMALREFMWMLSGSTSTKDLRKSSPAMADIWDNWSDKFGDVGPTYGAQYRSAGATLGAQFHDGVDQLAQVIDRLKNDPFTRRAIISLWSAPELSEMALEPCMVLFQFSRRGERGQYLDLHVYQRSADMMLGVPFDLFQSGFLVHAVARELTLMGAPVEAGQLTWSAGDVHLYANQLEPAKLQLKQAFTAEPMSAKINIDSFPSLRLLDGTLEPGHVKITDYNPEPAINGGKIAV